MAKPGCRRLPGQQLSILSLTPFLTQGQKSDIGEYSVSQAMAVTGCGVVIVCLEPGKGLECERDVSQLYDTYVDLSEEPAIHVAPGLHPQRRVQ